MKAPEAIIADLQSIFKARTVFTACELDLFSTLHDKPSTAASLAHALDLNERALTRILDCMVAFDYLKKDDHGYRTTETGAFLSSRHPRTLLPMALHYSFLWDQWSNLTEIAKEGPPQGGLAVLERDPEILINAMHVIGRRLSEQIAADYDLRSFTRFLDIGGASGTYTIAFLKENPRLRAVIFDFEPVIELARKHINDEGFEECVEFVSGDFYKDPLPGPCDLALLSAIIHQNSPDQNIDLFKKVFQVLDPGGAILIRDYVMDDSRTTPLQGTTFAINMLVNTPGGDTYTFAEIKEQLEQAGFRKIALLREDDRMGSLVEGRKI